MIITEHLCSERPTDADISTFEKLIHGMLPQDYKAFLKNENGGRPKPRRFQFTTRAGRAEDSAVHYFFGLYEGRVGSLKKSFEMSKGRILPGSLPIGKDPFGNLILLGIADQNLGRVYFWDHEKETEPPSEQNISLITASLAKEIGHISPTGVELAKVKITKSSQFEELYPGKSLPEFRWLKVFGAPGKDDFGISGDYRLVVSERILKLLKRFGLSHCDITDWTTEA